MKRLPIPLPTPLRLKLPFLVAGFFSFLFSVWLYFVQGETTAGIFVGLWVPSIHSLGTLMLAPVDVPAAATDDRRERVMS
ncbi:MAG: hypothetical protein WCA57_06055 [Ilumatobacteraceae bacterium]